MKNLLSLMEEFSILGMDPAPLDPNAGIDFMAQDGMATEEEYELDADGNPLLDGQGNPIKKIATGTAVPGAEPTACGCDHREGDLPAALPVPTDGITPTASATVPQLPPEDEFDFTV